MKELHLAGLVDEIQAAAERNCPIREGDYLDDRGLYTCGTCHRHKEVYVHILGENRKLRCSCACDLDVYAHMEAEEKRQAAMRAAERLRAYSLMDERLFAATFASAQTNEANARSMATCARYAERFEQVEAKRAGLLLSGAQGTGKTYAAACIANELTSRQIPVLMASVPRLTAFGEADTVCNRLRSVRLLILDDLGAERATDTSIEAVYRVVDAWYNLSRPLVVTTNWTMRELANPSDARYARICDRLVGMCQVPLRFAGTSYRRAETARGSAEIQQMLEVEG